MKGSNFGLKTMWGGADLVANFCIVLLLELKYGRVSVVSAAIESKVDWVQELFLCNAPPTYFLSYFRSYFLFQ